MIVPGSSGVVSRDAAFSTRRRTVDPRLHPPAVAKASDDDKPVHPLNGAPPTLAEPPLTLSRQQTAVSFASPGRTMACSRMPKCRVLPYRPPTMRGFGGRRG
ncbi:hypothetical protein GCM10027610_039830 [Dactylosporangium cerinum]